MAITKDKKIIERAKSFFKKFFLNKLQNIILIKDIKTPIPSPKLAVAVSSKKFIPSLFLKELFNNLIVYIIF